MRQLQSTLWACPLPLFRGCCSNQCFSLWSSLLLYSLWAERPKKRAIHVGHAQIALVPGGNWGPCSGLWGLLICLTHNSADFWQKFNISSLSPSPVLAELTPGAAPKGDNKIPCSGKLEESITMNIYVVKFSTATTEDFFSFPTNYRH